MSIIKRDSDDDDFDEDNLDDSFYSKMLKERKFIEIHERLDKFLAGYSKFVIK